MDKPPQPSGKKRLPPLQRAYDVRVQLLHDFLLEISSIVNHAALPKRTHPWHAEQAPLRTFAGLFSSMSDTPWPHQVTM